METRMAEGHSSLRFLDDNLAEVTTALDVVNARKERLYRAVFTDGDRALRADYALTTTRGAEETIRILGDGNGIACLWHFGLLRGGLLTPGKRTAVREALQELPETIRMHQQLIGRRKDLLMAREEVLAREEGRSFTPRDLQRQHDRPQTRTRQWRSGRHLS
jgi:hypothetical protein